VRTQANYSPRAFKFLTLPLDCSMPPTNRALLAHNPCANGQDTPRAGQPSWL